MVHPLAEKVRPVFVAFYFHCHCSIWNVVGAMAVDGEISLPLHAVALLHFVLK
jgi:hypothetical protein